MNGTVFSVEEFSIYDGPGIRTTVFLKGCPLRCVWCHSPEGQLPQPQIVRSPNGCLHCGACEAAAVREDGRLVFTPQSIAACPRGLLRVCGEEMTPQALCARVGKNAELLADGGVTFSGGEPLAQSDFLFSCLRLLRGTLHTAVQTCGFAPEPVFRQALALADLFLFDLKLIDDGLHRRYTGVSNTQILRNFSLLAHSGRPLLVRVPLIPGVTDTPQNLDAIAAFYLASYAKALADYAAKHPVSPLADLGERFFAGFEVRLRALEWAFTLQRDAFEDFDPALPPRYGFLPKWRFALWALERHVRRIASLRAKFLMFLEHPDQAIAVPQDDARALEDVNAASVLSALEDIGVHFIGD